MQEASYFPVRVAKAEQNDVPIFLEGLGHVNSITAIDIRSRIEGEITGVYFQQGQEVKKGELLFTIDPKPYEAALKQAKGTLDRSLADLAISAEKVKRYRTLANDEYFSQIDFETLQANFAANQGIVEQNRALVDRAAINLDYCWIYAPIDGMMGILQIDYGNLVSADSKTMVTLNQMAPIYVTFSIPEFQLPQIQKVMNPCKPLKVLVAYEKFGAGEFEGKLYMIDNAVDAKTGMIKLRAVFDNEQRQLWPGQFVRARLILDVQKDAVVIPSAAVQMALEGPIAFVVKENRTVEERRLKLGQRQDDSVIALEGISPGDILVTEGQINLSSGSKVFIQGSL